MDNKLQSLIKKFVDSKKEHGFKRLMESELFFEVDYDEMEKTRTEFIKAYEKFKVELNNICGKPIVEDISAYKFQKFELTKNEKLADMLTLFKYKDCRFGILLWQEDKELPIELCLSAYNEKVNVA